LQDNRTKVEMDTAATNKRKGGCNQVATGYRITERKSRWTREQRSREKVAAKLGSQRVTECQRPASKDRYQSARCGNYLSRISGRENLSFAM